MFPLKSSYCGKIFISIQLALNVWEQFEVQNPDILGWQWILTAYNFLIQGPFSKKFIGKVVPTSLVCVAKISYQSKELWVIERHFSKRMFSCKCVSCKNEVDTCLLFSLSSKSTHLGSYYTICEV